MDATNDTEVVKQSMSSMIATFIGMGLLGLTIVVLFGLLNMGLNNYIIMLVVLVIYLLIAFGLWGILNKNCEKNFNSINV